MYFSFSWSWNLCSNRFSQNQCLCWCHFYQICYLSERRCSVFLDMWLCYLFIGVAASHYSSPFGDVMARQEASKPTQMCRTTFSLSWLSSENQLQWCLCWQWVLWRAGLWLATRGSILLTLSYCSIIKTRTTTSYGYQLVVRIISMIDLQNDPW